LTFIDPLMSVFRILLSALALLNTNSGEPPSGPALLRRVLRADNNVPFEARQTVVITTMGNAEATVSDERYFGSGRSQIEYMMPKSAAGRLVVNDGRFHWEYDPASKVVFRSEDVPQVMTSERIEQTVAKVLRSYKIWTEKKPVLTGGHPKWVLHLDPLRSDRPRRTWWIDKVTFVVLRRELFDSSGTLDQTTTFTGIRYLPTNNTEKIKFKIPSGSKVISRPTPRFATDIPSARKMAPAWAQVPSTIGKGLEFDSARLLNLKGTPSLQLQYSDGLNSVSLVEIQGTAELPSRSGDIRVVQIGSVKGTISEPVPPYRVLSWSHNGHTYNLVGDMTEASLVDTACTLQ
jgi:outer membrane lipoprotein-sorting protein